MKYIERKGERKIPTTIKCRECGHVLREIEELPGVVEWYSNLLEEIDGRCPKCGRKLPKFTKLLNEMEVEVKKAENKPKRRRSF